MSSIPVSLNDKFAELLKIVKELNPSQYEAVNAKFKEAATAINAAVRMTITLAAQQEADKTDGRTDGEVAEKKRLRKHRCSAKPCSHRSSCKGRCREVGTIDDEFMIDKEDMWYCGDCYSTLKDKYRGAAQPDENEESLDDNEDSDDGLSDVSESETD